jgi:hypothetical protein
VTRMQCLRVQSVRVYPRCCVFHLSKSFSSGHVSTPARESSIQYVRVETLSVLNGRSFSAIICGCPEVEDIAGHAWW